MVYGKPLTKRQMMLQRFENTVALVDADIRGVQSLDYSKLLFEMKARLGHTKVSELLSSFHDDLEGLDKISTAMDTPGLHIAGDIFSFLANMIRLIGFRRMGRPLTAGEKIITGLCLASIILTVASLILGLGVTGIGLVTLGFVLTGVVIGRAVISLIKFTQILREKDNELQNRQQVALHSKEVVSQRIAEINASHPENEAENLQALRRAVDEYVADGYIIHKLRAEIEHRRNKITNRIHFAMKGLVITGAILLLFAPLVGAIMIGSAGLIATVTVIVGWIHRRYELKKHAAEDTTVVSDEASLQEASPTVDSTTIEMLELSLHAPSEKPNEVVVEQLELDDPLPPPPSPRDSVAIAYSKESNIHEEKHAHTYEKK